MSENILDNELVASEATLDEKKFAGFWIRVGASLIDVLVYAPFIGFNFYNLFSLKSLPLQIIILLVMTLYKPFMEYKYGATFGKMAVKIKVVNTEFGSLTVNQAIIRYIPWLLGQIVSVITYILLFVNPDFNYASSMIQISQLQNESITPAYNYITSAIMLISCIVVAFTAKKQGLHDMMASTYCIYNDKKN